MKKWISIQLGSREHYAIPRVLESKRSLTRLLTDTWIPRGLVAPLRKVSPSLAMRTHLEIPDDKVRAANVRRIFSDLSMKARKVGNWEAILERNIWFQEWAANHVRRERSGAEVCFSYSYTAAQPFREAKKRGMSCILGQIDPGPLENELVDEAAAPYSALKLDQNPPPAAYWEKWRAELELADQIWVNSEWSAELMVRQGISSSRLRVVPLAYEGRASATPSESGAPSRPERKEITVLFLGQVILRKGVGQLFDAIKMLEGEPFRFIFAGPIGVKVPPEIAAHSQVQLLGSVDRERTKELYREADVFILPTLSDGFAITQLEALAQGLPVIASRYCGKVVEDGINGLILDEVTPEAITESLKSLLSGGTLAGLKSRAVLPERFSLASLADEMVRHVES